MIVKVPEPTGSTGAADFYYGKGLIPYSTVRVPRPGFGFGAVGITTEIGEIVGTNITQTFTLASGSTPQTSPESRITVVCPTSAILVYLGHFWYDWSNPTGNTNARIYRAIFMDGGEIGPSRGLFHECPPGKGFESVVDDELFYAQVFEWTYVGAGTHIFEHKIWVDNPASLVTNLQFKWSDRAWSAVGFFVQAV